MPDDLLHDKFLTEGFQIDRAWDIFLVGMAKQEYLVSAKWPSSEGSYLHCPRAYL